MRTAVVLGVVAAACGGHGDPPSTSGSAGANATSSGCAAPRPPPPPAPPRPALEERPLPVGALARFGGTAFRLPDDVVEIAASSDGRFIAARDEGNELRVWDAASGREVYAPRRESVRIVAAVGLAFAGDILLAPDGKGTIEVIAVADGKVERVLRPCTKRPVRAFAVSPDGSRLAVTCDGSPVLALQPIAGGRAVPIAGIDEHADAVAWTSDGAQIAVAHVGAVGLVDVAARAVLPELPVSHTVQSAIAFAPNGNVLATPDDGVTLYDLAGKRDLVHVPNTIVGAVAFARDGSLVYAPWLQAAALVHVERGTGARRELLRPARDVRALAAGPDSTSMWVGVDQCVRRWDLAADAELAGPAGHCGAVLALAYASDGKTLASGSADGTIRLWNLAARSATILEVRGGPVPPAFSPSDPAKLGMGEVTGLAWSRDGRTLHEAELSGIVRTWDAAARTMRSARTGLQNQIHGLVLSVDDRLAFTIGSGDRTDLGDRADFVFGFDPATGTRERSFHARNQGFARSPDGTRLAFAMPDRVRVIDLATGTTLADLPRKDAVVLALSADGRRLAVSGDARTAITIYDVDTKTSLEWRSSAPASALAFTPDGRLVVGRLDGSLGIAPVGQAPPAFHAAHHAAIRSLAIAPDAKQLATGSHDGEILLWPLPAF